MERISKQLLYSTFAKLNDRRQVLFSLRRIVQVCGMSLMSAHVRAGQADSRAGGVLTLSCHSGAQPHHSSAPLTQEAETHTASQLRHWKQPGFTGDFIAAIIQCPPRRSPRYASNRLLDEESQATHTLMPVFNHSDPTEQAEGQLRGFFGTLKKPATRWHRRSLSFTCETRPRRRSARRQLLLLPLPPAPPGAS
jgi:hypothetical protein